MMVWCVYSPDLPDVATSHAPIFFFFCLTPLSSESSSSVPIGQRQRHQGCGMNMLAMTNKVANTSTPGVAVLKLVEPVEWPSFDGVPVDVALALYVPAGEAGTTHLRLLSKAAVMLMDAGFRDKVRASTNPVEIAELINSGLED